ncbi:MAG: hypothetical protein JW847_01105 [Candidatus Omnitrophica bacterium]|nr:hypothetical protein [Candidatus Omnitrophota bacterium]
MDFSSILLFALGLAVIYPLHFWIRNLYPSKNRIRKLNIAIPNVIGGFILISVWLMDFPLSLKLLVTVWKASLLSVSWYSWRLARPDPRLMTLPCVIGMIVFMDLKAHFSRYEKNTKFNYPSFEPAPFHDHVR